MKIEQIEKIIEENKKQAKSQSAELDKNSKEKNVLDKEIKFKRETIEKNKSGIKKQEQIIEESSDKYTISGKTSLIIIVWGVGGFFFLIGYNFWLALLNFTIALFVLLKLSAKYRKKVGSDSIVLSSKSEIERLHAENRRLVDEIAELNRKLKNTVELKVKENSIAVQSLNKKNHNNHLLISFNKKYDIDNNDQLDIAETTNVDKLISLKQKEIRDIEKSENRDYMKDLSKICIFLESFQKQLLLDYDSIQNSIDNPDDITHRIKNFDREFEFYKALISSLVLMISNIVNDNTLGYYKLRDLFDKLSIFESNFEKKMISKLETLNETTRELINITANSRDEIVDALFDVGLSVDDIKHKF